MWIKEIQRGAELTEYFDGFQEENVWFDTIRKLN